jgi:hypothetical protein
MVGCGCEGGRGQMGTVMSFISDLDDPAAQVRPYPDPGPDHPGPDAMGSSLPSDYSTLGIT